MADLFSLTGEPPAPGILLHAKFKFGYCGVIELNEYHSLRLEWNEDRMNVTIKGREWIGGFEHPGYIFKDKQPYNRTSPDTYLGVSFSDLDGIPKSNGGRFLSAKQPRISNGFSAISKKPKEIVVIHPASQLDNMSQDLGTMLELIGVPPTDVPNLQRDIFGRMGYDTDAIAPSYHHVDSLELFKATVKHADDRMSSGIERLMHGYDNPTQLRPPTDQFGTHK